MTPVPNPTDTARALVRELEEAARETIYASMSQEDRAARRLVAETELADARAALLAHVAEMAQQLARYKEIYESNSAAFIAIRKAFGIEADETVVPYILKYAPPLATRPTEARDDG